MDKVLRKGKFHEVMSALKKQLPIDKNSPWLAPLAGYTDLPFRLLCREMGAAVACTEMLSAKGLVMGQGKKGRGSCDLLQTYPALDFSKICTDNNFFQEQEKLAELAKKEGLADTPLVVQLFGAEADVMAEAVKILQDAGFEWFDLNMGCSVPKVGKSGSGSAMLKDKENCLKVAENMLKVAGQGRVGFKLRLGWLNNENTFLDIAKELEGLGAGWLTLHARSAKQSFSGEADWTKNKLLAESVKIPTIVSGDLFTAKAGVRAIKETGAAGVMFARGAMSNPAIFREFVADFSALPKDLSGIIPLSEDPQELERVIRRHMQLVRAFYPLRKNRQGIESGLLKMRTFVPRYVKHCVGAKSLRQAVSKCASWSEFELLLDDFFGNFAGLEKIDEDN